MAKSFTRIVIDHERCRTELLEFGALLAANAVLSERADILPFFKARPHLAAFIGSFMRDVGPATEYAFEYPIGGDFATDLVVGVRKSRRFCVVEFEDGKPDSLFKQVGGRSMAEWGRRFERGFSQIVDWFTLIDDLKPTARFQRDFGPGYISFSALLVIGRDAGLSDYDRRRLEWRCDQVRIDGRRVDCVTFDGLFKHMAELLNVATV